MKTLKYLFTPNASVSNKTFAAIFVVETVILLLVWHFGKAAYIPGPLDVLFVIDDLFVNDNLLNHLMTSLFLSISAMAIAVTWGMFVAYMSRMPIGSPVSVMTTKLRFASFSGFVFIFCMVFPSGLMFKVYSLAFAIGPWIVTSAVAEFDDIKTSQFIHLRTLGFSEWKIFREVILFGKADKILEIIRQNNAMVWMMIATVEAVYISEGGIGALLEAKRKFLVNLPSILAIQIIVYVMSMFTDNLFSMFNKLVVPWATLSNEKK